MLFNISGVFFGLELAGIINIDEELVRLDKELNKIENEISVVENKLFSDLSFRILPRLFASNFEPLTKIFFPRTMLKSLLVSLF